MARTRDTRPSNSVKSPIRSTECIAKPAKTKRLHTDTVSNENEMPTEVQQPSPPKKLRTAEKKSTTSALPAARRSTRNDSKVPAKPTSQKRKRRTKEQMAADRAAAEAEKVHLDELEKAKENRMMQLDLEDDSTRAETESRRIRKLSDLDQMDSGEEEFVGYHDVSSDSSSSAEDRPMDNMQILQRNNATLQKEVPVKAHRAQVNGGGKKSVGGKKTSKHVTFASGLRSDWNSQTGLAKDAKKQSRVTVTFGGLGDSDIEDTNAFATKIPSSRKVITEEELAENMKKATRDPSRRNELVTEVTDSDDDFIPPPPPPKSVVPRAAAKHAKHTTLTKVKNDLQTQKPSKPATVANTVTKTRRLNSNNVRIDDLPEFLKLKWRKTILPTLYDKFFASKEPFAHFFKGSTTFVNLLQTIIDEVFPATDYEVTATDALHHLSYNRINERRSYIGATAIEIVKRHINILNGEQEVREWIRWALRGDGPLFFRVPTPADSPLDRGDPAYTPPEGRLLSPFIIELAKPCFRLKAGSVSENGYPRGLFALILAALERAVRSLLKPTGQINEFSNEYWGSKVTTYVSSLRVIEESRWMEIFDVCDPNAATVEDSDDETHHADLSLLDNNRAFIFDIASPKKH